MKYVAITWPDVQEYMELPEFKEESFFDSEKNVWLIPEWWETEKELEDEFNGGNIGDLEDAMG